MGIDSAVTTFFQKLGSTNLVLVVGSSGSGKSQLIFSYFDYLTQTYTPDEFGIIAYDVVRIDYWEKEPVMPWVKEVRNQNNVYQEKILSDIQFVEERKSGKIDSSQRIVIHINECDLFLTNLKDSVTDLCEVIADCGKDINVQLIYETSRPTGPALTENLIDIADVKIMCPVANIVDAQYFLGTTEGLPERQGQIKVKFNNLAGFEDYDFNLQRKIEDSVAS